MSWQKNALLLLSVTLMAGCSNGFQSATNANSKSVDTNLVSRLAQATPIANSNLSRVGNNFFLYNKIELKYNGAPVTLGQAGYYPIAAVETSTGYDVAWFWSGYGTYTVWSVDANGNYTGNLIGWVAGNTSAIWKYEIIFAQDLNGDGIIGMPPTPPTIPIYGYGSPVDSIGWDTSSCADNFPYPCQETTKTIIFRLFTAPPAQSIAVHDCTYAYYRANVGIYCAPGFSDHGVVGYISATQLPNTVPVYICGGSSLFSFVSSFAASECGIEGYAANP
jgi:hypothetical protein